MRGSIELFLHFWRRHDFASNDDVPRVFLLTPLQTRPVLPDRREHLRHPFRSCLCLCVTVAYVLCLGQGT
jgi:hypothetical protein